MNSHRTCKFLCYKFLEAVLFLHLRSQSYCETRMHTQLPNFIIFISGHELWFMHEMNETVQYRSKVLVLKHAAKPHPPPFCFPRICRSGTKTATSVRTKATEHRG